MMVRTYVFTIAFALTCVAAAPAQTLPPQPPPVDLPMSQADAQERAACRPDVVKFCKRELDANAQDVLSILNCLQHNRPRISSACQTVLANHGQ